MNEATDLERTMSETTWVVAIDWTGSGESYQDVYATADSRMEAAAACNDFCRANPDAYAQPLTWDEAAELGLVS